MRVHLFFAYDILFEPTHSLLDSLPFRLFGLVMHVKLHLEETILLALLLELFLLLLNDFFEIVDFLGVSCEFCFLLLLVRSQF